MKSAFLQSAEPLSQAGIPTATEIDFVLILATLLLATIFLWPRRKPRIGDGVAWVVAYLAFPLMLSTAIPRYADLLEHFQENPRLYCGAGLAVLIATGIRVRWQQGMLAGAKWLGLTLLLTLPLFALIFPPVAQARESQRFKQCRRNLKAMGKAMSDYRKAHNTFPSQQTGNPPHSWRVDLLPFLGQKPIHENYRFDLAWDSPKNDYVAGIPVPEYLCPTSRRDRDEQGRVWTSYALLFGPHAVWTASGPWRSTTIPDGASHTAIIVEACGQNIVWTEPRDIDIDTTPITINLPGEDFNSSTGVISTWHDKGANVLMADGSVRRVPLNTDPKILRTLITIDDGDKR